MAASYVLVEAREDRKKAEVGLATGQKVCVGYCCHRGFFFNFYLNS